jgi:hypothetical protein
MAVDSPGPGTPRSETPMYMNIPVSPTSRQQLHYMGLELPGTSVGVRGRSPWDSRDYGHKALSQAYWPWSGSSSYWSESGLFKNSPWPLAQSLIGPSEAGDPGVQVLHDW